MTSHEKTSWLTRLKTGLQRSSAKLVDGLGEILASHKIDQNTLAMLEDLLIAADLGPTTSGRLVAQIAKTKFDSSISEQKIKEFLADQITTILEPFAVPLRIDPSRKPFVVLVVGVNGSGKTTTLGKLAHQFKAQGLKTAMVAGDTFRAAAISQLKIWGERTGTQVIFGDQGDESAALAYRALEMTKKDNTDVLLIDTAGRLHNKNDLMQELAKTIRVLKKLDPTAPHSTLLVLDATTGQNAHPQVEVFKEITKVSGLIVTKLDGSAKGGVLVALADRFGLPIHSIGVGEGVEDLQPFKARDYARSLLGLEI